MSLLLALHGFTGSPRSWDFLPEAKPGIAPALVGHAGSAAGSEIASFEAEVDRLAALLPDGEAVHAVGYSLGARLALALALRHPARVSRLTLLSVHPGLNTETERAERRAADGRWCELLLADGVSVFADAWQAQPMWATQAALPEPLRAQKRAQRLSHTAVGLVHSLRTTGLGQMPGCTEKLQQIRVPTTLLAGELDAKFSALARLMAERLSHAKLQIVPGAGHDLLLERPELVTAVIRRGIQT